MNDKMIKLNKILNEADSYNHVKEINVAMTNVLNNLSDLKDALDYYAGSVADDNKKYKKIDKVHSDVASIYNLAVKTFNKFPNKGF